MKLNPKIHSHYTIIRKAFSLEYLILNAYKSENEKGDLCVGGGGGGYVRDNITIHITFLKQRL